jgi:pimeloyl-ACP methyl ester carboxylesterase
MAGHIPLTSLSDDVASTRRAIDAAQGAVMLVGHSWGGAVITQAGDNAKVKALVYVAAFAPDVGMSVLDFGNSKAANAILAATSAPLLRERSTKGSQLPRGAVSRLGTLFPNRIT